MTVTTNLETTTGPVSDLTGLLDDEPNLDALIQEGHQSTWRDKKEFCYLEGKTYAEEGAAADENPYYKNTWPWQWFNESFFQANKYPNGAVRMGRDG